MEDEDKEGEHPFIEIDKINTEKITKKPLTEKEIRGFLWEIKEIREEKSTEEKERLIKKWLPRLLVKRLKEQLKEDGKEIVEIGEKEGEEKEKRGEEIFVRESYGWIEEELKIWQHIKMSGGKKWRPIEFSLKKEEVEKEIESFLKEVGEISEEELNRIEKEREGSRGRDGRKKGKIIYIS